MDTRLQRVLDFLNRSRLRATYGAVGDAIGGVPARAIGEMLGEKRPEASWVVNRDSGEPTGYQASQCHPELHSNPYVIRSGTDLLRRMAGLDVKTERRRTSGSKVRR